MSNIAPHSIYDVVVLGAGFAGALTALIAQKKGCRVLLIEKGQHPRMAIGESTTPLTNLLLEEIANDHDLPFLLNFTQYGKWKKNHSDIRVGLKRGFSFYNHQPKSRSFYQNQWDRELFMAASPNTFVADTQWWREDWDSYLVDQCKRLGVGYWEHSITTDLTEKEDGISLRINHNKDEKRIKARLLIDACGGRGGIGHLLNISRKPLKHTPKTFAVYGHFNEVESVHTLHHQTKVDDLPYEPEHSAIHHMIDKGWIWSLKFDHGPVSAGAILTEEGYGSIKDQKPEDIWSNLMAQNQKIDHLFKKSIPLYPMQKIDHVGFHMERTYGDRWIMLPSSAGFVDPLLSTGFPLTLLGIQRLAPLLSTKAIKSSGPLAHLNSSAKAAEANLNMVDHMIGTLFTSMNDFRQFAATSLVYFAAVSFTETARRLGKKQLAPGFIFGEHPNMSAHILATFETIKRIHLHKLATEKEWSALQSYIDEAIEPFNVIGLSTKAIHPYFPADSKSLFKHAHKLRTTSKDIQNMLVRSGLA